MRHSIEELETVTEGKTLLAPLLDELARLRATAAREDDGRSRVPGGSPEPSTAAR